MPKIQEKKEVTAEKEKRKGNFFYANGKRKCAIAKVRLYPNGSGDIRVNDKPLADYFFGALIGNIKSALKLTNHLKDVDVIAEVEGGGVPAQSDAIRHGIAKALLAFNPALRQELKKAGFLTRDPRVKERKKFGLRRARRAPQWSKR